MMCIFFFFFPEVVFLIRSSAAEPVAHIRNSRRLIAQVLPRVSAGEHASDQQHGLQTPPERRLFAHSSKGQPSSVTSVAATVWHRRYQAKCSFRTHTHTHTLFTPEIKNKVVSCFLFCLFVCFYQVSESAVKSALQHSSDKVSEVEDPRLQRQK